MNVIAFSESQKTERLKHSLAEDLMRVDRIFGWRRLGLKLRGRGVVGRGSLGNLGLLDRGPVLPQQLKGVAGRDEVLHSIQAPDPQKGATREASSQQLHHKGPAATGELRDRDLKPERRRQTNEGQRGDQTRGPRTSAVPAARHIVIYLFCCVAGRSAREMLKLCVAPRPSSSMSAPTSLRLLSKQKFQVLISNTCRIRE